MIASSGRLIGRRLPGRGVSRQTWMSTAGGRVLPRAALPPSLRGGRLLARGYAVSADQQGNKQLDLLALDKKWRDRWAASEAVGSNEAAPAPAPTGRHKYVLPMFPYPSGNLHLGHLRVYTIADVVARFYRLQGHDVLLPMGFDSFGLPAENAALQRGVQPAAWTRANIANMKAQLGVMNGSFDWTRQLSTCEPDFYKHTQRIFLQLHEQGLAYQAEAEVNYDPVDQTVLANEQVDAHGRSWRSGAVVEKRQLRQWFLRISAFRDALLDDLDVLARDGAWPERVLAMQRNWLGRSSGALVTFRLLGGGSSSSGSSIDVFTTRIDTLMGVQYIALAAAHPLVQAAAQDDPALRAFLDALPGLPADAKAGYELPGLRAINPLAYHDQTPAATKTSLPVFVAPYVLGDYGEGAVMGVPGHDERDHAFWLQHRADEPVRVVVRRAADESADESADDDGTPSTPYVGHGVMTKHSGPFCGRSSEDAAATLLTMLEAAGLAAPAERWRLRDWLVSRQRYWGAPIPIVHCDGCGAVPVPVADLPVTLPPVDDHFAERRPGSPLAGAAADAWANVPCPQCQRPARRETDTMDTFVDSSWYYLRFVDPHNADAPFAPETAAARLPVDIYIGGIEHAILHLLYARFVYKALMASPLGSAAVRRPHEPFARLITQGMVHGRTYVDAATGRFLPADQVDASSADTPRDAATGAAVAVSYEKMSKSKHNGIDPTDFIATHGADATRAHVLFQAPVADVLRWDDDKVAGITRWLGRLHDLVAKAGGGAAADATDTATVTDDLRRRAQTLAETVDPVALARWDADAAAWRDVQTAIASVTASYERVYSLNTVVSDLMRLTNSLAAREDAVSPPVLRHALSALVRLLAPVAPAFSEECWSLLQPAARPLFAPPARPSPSPSPSSSPPLFPTPDGSLAWLQPRLQTCAVQLNGRLRCAVAIPRPPPGLAGDALRDWLVEAILQTDEGRAKLAGDGGGGRTGSRDIRQAKKAIVVRDGKLVNFVF